MKRYRLIIPDKIDKKDIGVATIWASHDGDVCERKNPLRYECHDSYYFSDGENFSSVGCVPKEWIHEVDETPEWEKAFAELFHFFTTDSEMEKRKGYFKHGWDAHKESIEEE